MEKRHIRLTSGGGSLSNRGKLMSRTDALQFLTVIFAWLFPGVGAYWAVALLFITLEIPIWEWKSKSEEGYLNRCSLYTHYQRASKKRQKYSSNIFFIHLIPRAFESWLVTKATKPECYSWQLSTAKYLIVSELCLSVVESSQKMKDACQAM